MPPPVRALPQVQQDQQDILLRQLKGMLSHWGSTGATDTCPIKASLSKIDMARSALQLFTARSGPYKEILEEVHTHLFNTIELLDDRQQHLAATTSAAHSAIHPHLIDQMNDDGGVEGGGADGVTSQLIADKRARHLDRQLQRAADSHECNLQALRDELAAKDAVIANLKDLMHMQETRRIKGAAGGGGVGVAGVYDSRNEPQLTLDDDPSDDLRFPSNAEATIRRLEKIREHDTAIGRLRVCQEENSKLLQHISSVKELNGRYAMQASELAARVMALRDHNDRLATSLALRQDEFMQLEKENEVMKAELTDLSQVGHAGRMNFLLDFGGGDDSPMNELTTPREGAGDVFDEEKSSTGLKMHSMSFSQVAELRYAVYCIGSGMGVPRHLRANGIVTRVRLSKDAALFAVADILSLRQIPRFPPISYTIAAATLAPPKGVKRMSVKRQSSVTESGSATFQTGKYVDLPTFTFNYLAKRHGVDAVAWGYALDDCTRLFEADVNLSSFGQVTRGAISELIFKATSTDIVIFLQLCERLDLRTVANKRRREIEQRFEGFSPFGEQSTSAAEAPVAVEETPFSEPPTAKPTSRGVKFLSRTNSNASGGGINPRPAAETEPSMTLSSLQVLAVLHEMYPGYPDSAFRSLLDSLQSSLGAENTVHYQMMFPNAERIHLQGQADFGGGMSGRRPESGFTPRTRGDRDSLSMHTLSTNTTNVTSTSDYIFLPSAAELRPENSFSNLFKMLILDDAVVTMQTVCDAISGIPGAKVSMFDINDAVRDAFEGKSEVVVSELLTRLRQAVHVITMGGSISGAAESSTTSNPNSNSGATPTVATPVLPVVLPPVPKVDLVAVLRVHLLLRQSTIRPRHTPATPPSATVTIPVVDIPASDDGAKSSIGDTTDALATTSIDNTIDAEMEISANSQTPPDASSTASRVHFDALLQRPFFKEYAARLEVLAEEDVGTLEVSIGLGLDAGSLNKAPNKPPKIDPLDPAGYELDGLITEADTFARNHASLAL